MIGLLWQIVRARRTSLAGSFVALALGVALMTATALAVVSTLDAGADQPRWFTHADVVIAGDNTARLRSGEGGTVEVRTAESRALPTDLPARLSAVDATVTVDYATYAAVEGAPGATLHPWSAAALHGYAWEAGGPPRDAEHLVLTAPTRYQPGDRVAVRTAAGPRQFTISGVVRTAAPAAFYATDAAAADLAGGRIDTIALTSRPGTTTAEVAGHARAVVRGDPVRVLTGAQRRDAEPDPDVDLLLGATILLGNTAGLSAFISVFVVGSTFSYAVIARRCELALLRTAGATPGQVRRLVLGEALAVGMFGAGAGAALGGVIASPLALACWGGLRPEHVHRPLRPVAGRCGVRHRAADRAARSVVGRAPRQPGAPAQGAPCGGGRSPPDHAQPLAGRTDRTCLGHPGDVRWHGHRCAGTGYFLLAVLALLSACAALAPALIRPLLSALTAPMAMSRGAIGMLARGNVLAAVRRTAATAAPIMVTVGLAGAVLAGTATLSDTEQAAARSRITADGVVTGPIATRPSRPCASCPGSSPPCPSPTPRCTWVQPTDRSTGPAATSTVPTCRGCCGCRSSPATSPT